MSLRDYSNTINLLDDDDSIPEPAFARKRPAETAVDRAPAVAGVPAPNGGHFPAAAAKTKRPAKKPKKSKSFALIWVCTHGKGQSKAWRQKDLMIVGVYASKALAQQAKQRVMDSHDCYGHGDICVGGSYEDEIDLVIREAPLFLEE